MGLDDVGGAGGDDGLAASLNSAFALRDVEGLAVIGVCDAVRAPGRKCTVPTMMRGVIVRLAIHTSPVNQSARPLRVGCLGSISIGEPLVAGVATSFAAEDADAISGPR